MSKAGLKKADVESEIQRQIRDDVGVKLSTGNTKLEDIYNISLLPGVTCPGMVAECKFCYARQCMIYSTRAKMRWSVNTHYARNDLERFFGDVYAHLQILRPKYFRIHVGGDFFSQDYWDWWSSTAACYPKTRFLAFTKSFGHVAFTNKPDNLNLIWSITPSTDLETVPEGPRAYLVMGDHGDEYKLGTYRLWNSLRCIGSCSSCGMCFHIDENKHDVRFELHGRFRKDV